MNKCAVIIGVDKTGSLQPLQAASTGARDFASWASSQGYEISVHVDDKQPVTVQQILVAIRKFINEGTYSLMIIYFAGHGILKSANDEQWLLSDAPDNPNEAINVNACKFLARNTGIEHVVFISDACRSIPSDPLVTQVTGSVIFPNIRNIGSQNRTFLDVLYATAPGSPAFEVQENKAVKQYKGIFTKCLLDGLNGHIPSIIKTINDNQGKPLYVIPAFELGEHLRNIVPQVASKVHITLAQDPDFEVTSRIPKCLSSFSEVPSKITSAEPVKQAPDESIYIEEQLEKIETSLSSELQARNIELESDLQLIMNAKANERFETHTGFSLIGIQESDVQVIFSSMEFDMFTENDILRIRIYADEYSRTFGYSLQFTLLLQLKDGTTIPAAILPDFIGTIIFKDGKVANINYVPSVKNPRFNEAIMRNEKIERRRALIATAARYGKFRLDGDATDIRNAASYLRYEKAFDPTLGLYAAYAYAQAGDTEGILSVYKYMSEEPEPVLLDVTLLARFSGNNNSFNRPYAPFFPLLTQGWSYLAIEPNFPPEIVRELARHLSPGLWTTFTSEAKEILMKLHNR